MIAHDRRSIVSREPFLTLLGTAGAGGYCLEVFSP